jgi:TolB-like protein
MGMANFFAELKRRHIYRVAAAYAVVAWLLIQLVNNLAPMLRLPDWAGSFFLVLLLVSFPIVLLIAWIHQLAPEDGALAHVTTGKLDWALMGALVVVIALVSYQQLAPPGTTAAQQTEVESAKSAAVSPATAVSLAVLPFSNLSGDASQEFFSDGMTEEITSALARIPDLRVVARTSAYQFRSQNRDIQSIGQQLNATHFIEGSVRKAGERVRITAQLIKADDGTHVWTETYDRQLTDIFAVQEEIATAIASALRVPLGLKEGQSLVANRTTDTDSYQDYLRARALVRLRGPLEPGGPLTEAAKLLEQVVARDPNYAPAWGLLGQAYAQVPIFTAAFNNGLTDELRRMASESLRKAEAAAQQATRLDPNNIDGYNALGYSRNFRGGFVQAEDLFKQALSLDPGNPEALHQYSLMLATVGRLKDSLPMRLRLQAQEPLVPAFSRVTAQILWANGQSDEAIATLTALPPTYNTRVRLAKVYASMGRYSEAADALRGIPGNFLPGVVEEAVRLLRTAPAQAASPQTTLSAGELGFVYLYAGASDRVLDFYEGLAEAGSPALANAPSYLWAASYAPVRKTERFKTYVRKAGMVDYWRARGWPDLCRPMGADDFVCD